MEGTPERKGHTYEAQFNASKKRYEIGPEKKSKPLTQLALAGVLLMGALKAEHATTRYKVHEAQDAEGNVTFTHEDQQTTDVLNWISGKSELTGAEKLALHKAISRNILAQTKQTPPPWLATIDEDGLRTFNGWLYQAAFHMAPRDAVKDAETAFLEEIPSFSYSSELYTKLWQLEKEVGAPKIRFAATEEPSTLATLMNAGGSAWYNQVTNTVYISTEPSELIHTLVGESAHAYQMDKKPLSAVAGSVRDYVSQTVRSITEGMSMEKSHEHDYSAPGTKEYEAHTEIAPQLMQDLKNEKLVEKPSPHKSSEKRS